MKIFIGNLDSEIVSADLFDLFSAFGIVLWAEVARDEDNGSCGFGYVRMERTADGDQAITALNKKRFKQQYISVSEALCNCERA
jgi:heterogeneous nuclear ribonucleoprotein G